MNMMNVLFNPQGCVRGRSYWVGCAVLLGLAIAVQLIGYYVIMTAKGMQGMMMGSVFSMVLWLFIFPYFCLYGKRLHDVGVSATWFILILFMYAIANWIAQMMVVMPMMFAEDGMIMQQIENMEEFVESDSNGEVPDFSALMESQMDMQKQVMKKSYLPLLIMGACITVAFDAILGFLQPKLTNNQFCDDVNA